MTVDDVFKHACIETDNSIPEGDLRAYVIDHQVDCGTLQVAVLARDLDSARDLYVARVQEELGGHPFAPEVVVTEVTEKPLEEGILSYCYHFE